MSQPQPTPGLPPGLVLAPDGSITGTPTEPGLYAFTVQATDAMGNTATAALQATVWPELTITLSQLPPMMAGDQVTFTLEATGGDPPYTWTQQ